MLELEKACFSAWSYIAATAGLPLQVTQYITIVFALSSVKCEHVFLIFFFFLL